jgi:hypothetical protein
MAEEGNNNIIRDLGETIKPKALGPFDGTLS